MPAANFRKCGAARHRVGSNDEPVTHVGLTIFFGVLYFLASYTVQRPVYLAPAYSLFALLRTIYRVKNDTGIVTVFSWCLGLVPMDVIGNAHVSDMGLLFLPPSSSTTAHKACCAYHSPVLHPSRADATCTRKETATCEPYRASCR
jgi:hypothetical protein